MRGQVTGNEEVGEKLWEFQTGGQVNSSPAIGSDGTVYVGSSDKKLYAVNGKTGVEKWEFETGGGVGILPRHRLGWHGVRRVR